MNQGYIRLHRTLLDNPIVTKDSDYFTVWVHLILNATHKSIEIDHLGKRFTLNRGQLITGRKTISEKYNINESKVQRILKRFETEQQIEQQTNNKNRIVTILNYDRYQFSEQQDEQLVNNKRTTSEQQVNTNNNVLNVLNENNEKEKELKEPKGSMSVVTNKSQIDFNNILNYWNQHSKLKDITQITPKRKKFLEVRIKENGIDSIYTTIDNCGLSTFMRGDNNKNWIASFDWVFGNPNNFIKVLEGNYVQDKDSKGNDDLSRRAKRLEERFGHHEQ